MARFSTISMSLLICIILYITNADLGVHSVKGYPPLWDSAPENLEDFTSHDGSIFINPWNYLERHGMYKILLNVTAQHLDMNDPENKRNILWGLPIQHGWQYRSGRLADTQNQDKTYVSPRSWWACMNYYLSAIPFLGAVDAGLFDVRFPIQLSEPKEYQSDFCYNIPDCYRSVPKPMEGWKAFFEFIKTPLDVPKEKAESEFLTRMWEAHTQSIRSALLPCSTRLSFMSTKESSFGVDWAAAVEFLAATNFLTDFNSTNNFHYFLPPRILTELDIAPLILDFTTEQNRVVFMLHWLNKFNQLSGGHFLQLWKKAMCSEEGKAAGRDLIQNMITNPAYTPLNIVNIITALANNSTCEP
ncbi:protein LEG1 homolog [Spea bombifrons]|uniref:protein LEG1 homolog n=1 Tax=Spea bombifrons TaxID=233779 RepID=UPI00234BCBB3|nr:protein LEG1 homolog [Spea bombifrons]